MNVKYQTENFLEIKNIIWAVDVFTDIPEVEEIAAKNINLFTEHLKIKPKIFPVNVFSGTDTDDHFPYAEKEINYRLSKLKFINLEPLKVIPENMLYPTSINDKVLTLLDHARANSCDLIVSTTHSNVPKGHTLLGSFTNELISESTLPLMIVNTLCETKTHLDKVMIPMESVDLSADDLSLLKDITHRLNSRVDFFYHTHDVAARYFSPQGFLGEHFKNQLSKEKNRIEMQKKNLEQFIKNDNHNVNIVIQSDELSMKESICQYIKSEDISFFIFSKYYSDLKYKLSNRSKEYIIRNAHCPVLLLK